jgi:hypothetical protein
MRMFRDEPLHGTGAGTYAVEWTQERRTTAVVDDAHSLYVEVLAETGIVGFVLLVGALLAILLSLAPVGRGVARPLYAAAFAGVLAWAIRAGVDWDWEMPALSLAVFALGGLALARRADGRRAAPAAAVEAAPRHAGPPQGVRVAIGLAAVLAMVGPALVLVSERRLDRAVAAFGGGDCGRAVAAATGSIEILSIRPEPYEVLGFCQTRRGFNRLAVEALTRATRQDPNNWEFRYGLALVRAAAGLDPRADARAALALNPRDTRVRTVVQVIDRQPRWQAILSEVARHEQLSVVR